jgi:hypothetical protein
LCTRSNLSRGLDARSVVKGLLGAAGRWYLPSPMSPIQTLLFIGYKQTSRSHSVVQRPGCRKVTPKHIPGSMDLSFSKKRRAMDAILPFQGVAEPIRSPKAVNFVHIAPRGHLSTSKGVQTPGWVPGFQDHDAGGEMGRCIEGMKVVRGSTGTSPSLNLSLP